MAAAILCAVPAHAGPAARSAALSPTSSSTQSSLQAALLRPENAELRQFYYYRANRPLWIADGRISQAGIEAMRLIDSAALDGISPDAILAGPLDDAVRAVQTQATPAALDRAELALSRSFAAYVRLTRQTPEGAMLYEHVSLEPQVPGTALALQEAAKAASLDEYIGKMAWLHPLYAPMRQAFAAAGGLDSPLRRQFLANLGRVRALPAVPPGGRYVLVNAAAAKLWMYEGDRPVGSMNVVVGKVDHQTPMISGYIRYAILNPYWNVPADFTRDKIAARVMKGGAAYLQRGGYQVMSDWTSEATVIDPRTVGWKAVAAGAIDLRVRQSPGAANSMGKVKFEFPNQLGIYLHDTPEQELMARETRLYSSGCVRLQDAQRLGRWLFQSAMPAANEAEQRFDLPRLVPVYVTYLTMQPQDDGQVVMLGDPYGRDEAGMPAFAVQNGGIKASR